MRQSWPSSGPLSLIWTTVICRAMLRIVVSDYHSPHHYTLGWIHFANLYNLSSSAIKRPGHNEVKQGLPRAISNCSLSPFFLRSSGMYIDPGSGALVWQALLSAVFGVVFYFRNSVRQFVSRITRGRKSGAEGL